MQGSRPAICVLTLCSEDAFLIIQKKHEQEDKHFYEAEVMFIHNLAPSTITLRSSFPSAERENYMNLRNISESNMKREISFHEEYTFA